MYLNQVSLIGFIGKDAELKTTNNNRDFVVLSIATGRSWKDKESQEYKRQTEWHRIVAWSNLAKFAQNLKKGEHIFIQGELRPRKYGKQFGKGKNREEVTMYVADIQADTITRLRPGGASKEADNTVSKTPQQYRVLCPSFAQIFLQVPDKMAFSGGHDGTVPAASAVTAIDSPVTD